jgi:IS605 OrfB family transposase
MTSEMIFTYQARLQLTEQQDSILKESSALLNKVEHALFAKAASGIKVSACKTKFLKLFGITARHFNACRVSVEGKIAACKAALERSIATLKQQIASIEKKILLLLKKPSKAFELHQKKRRHTRLMRRLESLKKDKEQNRVSLCFGSKKLFQAQFNLEKNGFGSHEEWRQAWEEKRNSEFSTLGSKDEAAGNQTCRATLQDDGMLKLRLRLPPALEQKYGKYLEINGIVFKYGQEAVLASLNNPEGQALSYRFKKDGKGWRLFVATALAKKELISRKGIGAIGIDLNADHIALVETDRFGNPAGKKIIPWNSYGKTKEQLKALSGEVCKEIIQKAIETRKPLVIEELDFQKKKLSLNEGPKKFARLLSSFAYGQLFAFLKARAYKNGVEVHQVNPAFTSVIGRVNYAKRYGLTTHLAAALCIARRHQEFSESPSSSKGIIPDGKRGHVAFVLPERNRTKHVWHFWGQVKKKMATVLAAHFRAMRNRSSSTA